MAQSRDFGLDLVRVIAMTFVVAVHALCVVDWASRSGYWYATVGQSLFFSANALFFILSGMLNLKDRDDDKLGIYYFRKVRAILIPILVFFLIRSIYDCYPDITLGNVARTFVYGTLGGYSSIEYWFMFFLTGFLMVAPFLARIFHNMGKHAFNIFIGLGLGFHVLWFVTDNMGLPFSWRFPFDGFLLTFCLGALVGRLTRTERQRRWLYILTAVCFVASVTLKYGGWTMGAHDSSPLYTIYSLGLFVLISREGGALAASWPAKVKGAITKVAEHSFSVYMVHMMVLMPCSAWFAGMHGIASIGGQVVLTLVTVVISLVIAFVADWALIRPCQRGLDKIYEEVKRCRPPKKQEEPVF